MRYCSALPCWKTVYDRVLGITHTISLKVVGVPSSSNRCSIARYIYGTVVTWLVHSLAEMRCDGYEAYDGAIDLMPYNVFAYLRFSWQTAVATTLKGGAVPFAIRNMQHKLLRSIIRGLIGALLTYFWGLHKFSIAGLSSEKQRMQWKASFI